jgi:hypothetical protein
MFWIMLGLACFAYCQWTPTSESMVENYWLKGDTLLIRLKDGTGWQLDLYREGRGSIRYGRHPNNTLTFESIGFQFDSIRRQLAGAHRKEKTSGFRLARVAYLISDTAIEKNEVLHDTDLGKELFDIAFEASINSEGDLRAKKRLLKLFRNSPPFGRE